MDSFEWNKVFGAVLMVAFFVLGLTFLGEALYHPIEPETPGIEIEVAEIDAGGADAGPVGPEPIAPIFASATVEAGQNVAKKCVACHVFEEGGANKIGPILYDVMGRDIASVADFGYSGALTAYGAGKQWSYDEMNGFLWKPKTHVPGTSMGFIGLKKVEDRANIIAYLRSLSANPLPDPVIEEVAASAEGEAPADGEAPAEGAVPAEGAAPAEGAEAPAQNGADGITPAANVTGTDAGIDTGSDVPGATVAPAGANALGETQPADAAPVEAQAESVADEVVNTDAAEDGANTNAATGKGASVPLGGDASNPRAGAQSTGLADDGAVAAPSDGAVAPAQPSVEGAAPATTQAAPADGTATGEVIEVPEPVVPKTALPEGQQLAPGAKRLETPGGAVPEGTPVEGTAVPTTTEGDVTTTVPITRD